MRTLIFGLLLLSLGVAATLNPTSVQANDQQQLKDALVKIYTTSAAPDYHTPWRRLNIEQSYGSGAVIAGNRILTNAHVVADSHYLQAQKHGKPKKYLARVEFVSHAADLALLTVDDPEFFRGIQPLEIGQLPKPLEDVSVYGFPMGGSALSITRGVLSRVEHQSYAHAGSTLLAGQIDAAINPGNSGGPVIANQKIVGVVMQANTGNRAENLGYFVPPSVIQHVLKDAEDGRHDGFVWLGIHSQPLESPAMKAALGLTPEQSGVVVTRVLDASPAANQLHPDDVILEIDGHAIAGDATIEFRPNLRTHYKYAIDQLHPGEAVQLKLIRNGKQLDLTLATTNQPSADNLVRGLRFDQTPEYYIYGGVVFVPLNMNLIKRWGWNWRHQAPVEFVQARQRWSTDSQRELVVALRVLAADVNLGYHDWKNKVISSVNGKPIRDFQQFSDSLRNQTQPYTVFKDALGTQMIIDHRQALATEQEVLARYSVPVAHSPQLFSEQRLTDAKP